MEVVNLFLLCQGHRRQKERGKREAKGFTYTVGIIPGSLRIDSSNQCVVYLKLAQCYMSIISQ